MDEPVDELLAAAYALDSPAANRELYARWAATYDDGFVVDSGYQYPAEVAAVFAAHALAHVGADDTIIDIGCGTGLGGFALQHHRAVTIDGLDISPEMLRQAATKHHDGLPVYRSLIEADLTQPLPIADGTYAAAMSAGTFTHGHVGPAALANVIRVVRSGGQAVLGINAAHFAAAGFGAALDDLTRRGLISSIQFVDAPIYEGADLRDPDKFAHVAVLTVA